MLILNERDWAENALIERELGAHPVETLGRIARYLVQCEGYKKSEARTRLEEFLMACNSKAVMVKWAETLDWVVSKADKYKIIEIDYIPVTAKELEVMNSIGSIQEQRLAFTFLCVAKYWNIAREKNDNWVNTDDKEIMNMANIKTSITKQSILIYNLRNAGLIKYSKRVDNLNIQVLYIDNDGEPVLRIDDFRNLGNQYMMYKGEPYFKCTRCGLVVKRKSNRQKYCKECASEIYVKKSVESVMRQRMSS